MIGMKLTLMNLLNLNKNEIKVRFIHSVVVNSNKTQTTMNRLNMVYDNLETLPEIWNNEENLEVEVLELKWNRLRSLPSGIGLLTSLCEIDLSCNNFAEFPPEIAKLINLRKLNLCCNALFRIPTNLALLIHLRELYLKGNFLTEIPPEFGQLTELKSLTLKSNLLQTLPQEIGRLTNLLYLDLSDNKFSDIPNVINSLSKLEKLDLKKNSIGPKIETPVNLPTLKQLDLSDNRLTELFDLSGLSGLVRFHINENELVALHPSIGTLSSLSTLSLNGNLLDSLPLEISKLKLEHLYLAYNKFSYFPTPLLDCQQFIYLSLESNQLTTLPQEYEPCLERINLNLYGNPIASLPLVYSAPKISFYLLDRTSKKKCQKGWRRQRNILKFRVHLKMLAPVEQQQELALHTPIKEEILELL